MVKVILHCGGHNWGKGNGAYIGAYHIKKAKFDMIGYHYVILNGWTSNEYYDEYFDGHIETGRAETHRGAHTKGHNDAIGILIVCRTASERTDLQSAGLMELLKHLKSKHGDLEIGQHSDYSKSKSYCAGFTDEEMDNIRTVVKYNV